MIFEGGLLVVNRCVREVCLFTVAAAVLFGLVEPVQSRAQSPIASPPQSVADTWQGTLRSGQDLRVVFKISKAEDGYKAVFYSIDQGLELPVTTITLDGSTLKMTLAMDLVTYDWAPDDSQFGGAGGKMIPPADESSTLPSLYTAVQEQLGLRLEATRAPADVLVIDHVEKPSEN
jgi:Protein of unknown function (DUF3738)